MSKRGPGMMLPAVTLAVVTLTLYMVGCVDSPNTCELPTDDDCVGDVGTACMIMIPPGGGGDRTASGIIEGPHDPGDWFRVVTPSHMDVWIDGTLTVEGVDDFDVLVHECTSTNNIITCNPMPVGPTVMQVTDDRGSFRYRACADINYIEIRRSTPICRAYEYTLEIAAMGSINDCP